MRVRDRSPRGLGWWSRAWLAATAAWSLLAVLALLPAGAGTVPQAHADSGAKTVQGPARWQPDTQTYGPNGSVTVSQVDNLVDQVVHVSWTGFTTTVQNGVPTTVPGLLDINKMYQVRVYQCRGVNPKPTDCYGSTVYGGNPALGFQQNRPAPGVTSPDLPSNMAIAVTGADGTGSADIEVWSSVQSSSLGCDAAHACSLVVEPNYGGDSAGIGALINGDPTGAINCADHSFDTTDSVSLATDSMLVGSNATTGLATGEACAWNERAVVPLSFAPTASSCKAATTDFATAGLPMAQRALQQWRAGACLGGSPIYAGYTALAEPQARGAFLQGGGAEVALTARPDTGPAPRPYVYAPLADSGISVVFAVDDPGTGRQITHLRLDARLLAKELTQSYAQVAPSVQAASIAGNPRCLFEDPEFLTLNPPSAIAPAQWPSCDIHNPSSLPIVIGQSSDMIYQLTSWIAADNDAQRFLQGEVDEWGMHVDPFYLRPAFSGYPTDLLIPQDNTGFQKVENGRTIDEHEKQYEWSPVLGSLDDAARRFLTATPTCLSPVLDGSGSHPRCPASTVGTRQLIAVLDTADAKAFSLPEAELRNPAGGFVAPTATSMQAAVDDMATDPATGTRLLPYGVPQTGFAKDAAAYPLTTVQYAMLPTSGLGDAKALTVSRFFQKVTDPGGGQLYGRDPGKLGPGYLGLTAGQLADARAALTHVAAQDGALPGNQKPASPAPQSGTGNGSTVVAPTSAADTGTSTGGGSAGGQGTGAEQGGGTGSTGSTGGTATTPRPSTAASPSRTTSIAPIAAGSPAPDRAGLARMLLPTVLIAGGVLLVGGPAALLLAGTAAGGRVLTRLRRLIGG
ncbi:hypothetical protein C7C46_21085 [Streptomyces tateyamensis]|uniref:PBP domain-containing protein n=1 Tax=Streptomyces tateyamensis TaxID=565073 RepID=A0A2V4P2C8_9ACTN|nr:hypothetical protein [Streptomyces tateyamensis]PYC76889.1 hypothetical protein C7C46_21085 [Streptomyces tateyamensis]